MTLDYRNSVFAAVIAVYIPAFFLTTYLCFKHGWFSKVAGFERLLLLVIARIIGAGLELALINDPTSKDIRVVSSILLTIAISPLLWTTLGFLNRLQLAVNMTPQRTKITGRYIGVVSIAVLLGLILAVVGAVKASQDATSSTDISTTNTYTKAALVIWIVSYFVTAAMAVVLGLHLSSYERHDKIIFYAIVVALPLIAVRILYGAIGTFSGSSEWSELDGSTTLLLCVALVEEMLVTYLYDAVGVILPKKMKGDDAMAQYKNSYASGGSSELGFVPAQQQQQDQRYTPPNY